MSNESIEFNNLNKFASLLGWKNLRSHRYTDANNSSLTIHWYESEEADQLLLQINCLPTYRAAVFAMKFNICTGWHEFNLCNDKQNLEIEVDRLREWLDYHHFCSADGRKTFCNAHPECHNITQEHLLKDKLPYN